MYLQKEQNATFLHQRATVTLQSGIETGGDMAQVRVASAANSSSHQPLLSEEAPTLVQNIAKLSVGEHCVHTTSSLNKGDDTPSILSPETLCSSVDVHVPKASVTSTLIDELYKAASRKDCVHGRSTHCESFQYRRTAKVKHAFIQIILLCHQVLMINTRRSRGPRLCKLCGYLQCIRVLYVWIIQLEHCPFPQWLVAIV